MIRFKNPNMRYLVIGVTAVGIALIISLVIYTLTRTKTVVKPMLTSVTVTVTHPDGSPLADTSLSITNFGYAWNGMTDKNGTVVVPPQAIAAPVHLCALNKPRTTSGKCDLSASVDNSGKALESSNTLLVSLHNNMN